MKIGMSDSRHMQHPKIKPKINLRKYGVRSPQLSLLLSPPPPREKKETSRMKLLGHFDLTQVLLLRWGIPGSRRIVRWSHGYPLVHFQSLVAFDISLARRRCLNAPSTSSSRAICKRLRRTAFFVPSCRRASEARGFGAVCSSSRGAA